MVSVIVPIYNVEKYLRNCVDDILGQTYSDLEIVLVDDGSPDGCPRICDDYAEKDARIRVIHQANGGLSNARNAGLRIATGDYVLFVDSDDRIQPDLVERTVDLAEKCNADMVLFNYASVEEDTGMVYSESLDLPEGKAFCLADYPPLLFSTPAAWNKLYKRALWTSSGVTFPKGCIYEDLGTLPKLYLNAERVVHLPGRYLYKYMIRPESIMGAKKTEKNFRDRTEMLNTIRQYYVLEGEDKRYRKELSYLYFLHGFFVPCKELVLQDKHSPFLEQYRNFVQREYPEVFKNPYIKTLSRRDQILLFLLQHKRYSLMNGLSAMRHGLAMKRGKKK